MPFRRLPAHPNSEQFIVRPRNLVAPAITSTRELR